MKKQQSHVKYTKQSTCLYSSTMAGNGWKGSNCVSTASDVDVSLPTVVFASFVFPVNFVSNLRFSNST